MNQDLIDTLNKTSQLKTEIEDSISYSQKINLFFQKYQEEFKKTLGIETEGTLDAIVGNFSEAYYDILKKQTSDLTERISFLKQQVETNGDVIRSLIDSTIKGRSAKKVDLSQILGIEATEISHLTPDTHTAKKQKHNPHDSNLESDQDQITLSNGAEGAIIRIKGDGNCLFRAIVEGCKNLELSPELMDHFSDHVKLRKKVIEEFNKKSLETIQSIKSTISDEERRSIDEISEQDIGSYIDKMSKPTTWGGTPEIMAIATLLKKRIIIHQAGTQIKIPPGQDYDEWPVMLELIHESANESKQGENHYNLAVKRELSEITSPSHLRLETKSDLQKTTKTSKPNLKQILEHHYQSLDSQEKLQLEELTETITLSEEKSTQDSNDILLSPNNKTEQQRSSTKPKIHLFSESDHKIDHPNHIKNLLAHIDSLPTPEEGKTNNIIIALERKQEGKNLGMPDVILLAELIKKEEKLNQEKLDELPPIILIPDNVRNSLIYQDALLYKAAEEKGIKVIGIDKAKISAQKRPDQEGYDPKGYNEEREDHMIEMLVAISNSHPNHNIIFPVGASHIENISDALESRSLSVNVNDNVNNQETVAKTLTLTDVLNTELDSTANKLVALQQRMQLRSVSVETLNKLKATTQENAVPESHVDKLTGVSIIPCQISI